ncbi:hypothetical protein EON63_19765, partial [archaeon]
MYAGCHTQRARIHNTQANTHSTFWMMSDMSMFSTPGRCMGSQPATVRFARWYLRVCACVCTCVCVCMTHHCTYLYR